MSKGLGSNYVYFTENANLTLFSQVLGQSLSTPISCRSYAVSFRNHVWREPVPEYWPSTVRATPAVKVAASSSATLYDWPEHSSWSHVRISCPTNQIRPILGRHKFTKNEPQGPGLHNGDLLTGCTLYCRHSPLPTNNPPPYFRISKKLSLILRASKPEKSFNSIHDFVIENRARKFEIHFKSRKRDARKVDRYGFWGGDQFAENRIFATSAIAVRTSVDESAWNATRTPATLRIFATTDEWRFDATSWKLYRYWRAL